jgi:hypothetical protein
VDLLVDTNVLEEHTAFIFKAEVNCWYLYLAYKSTWLYNPEDQHRHLHRREYLKSDTHVTFGQLTNNESRSS